MIAGSSILLVLPFLASPPHSLPGATATDRPPGTIEVILVENEGFLLVMDGKKVLVDGLFHLTDQGRPAAEVRSATEGGEAPFDDLDLILVTHAHRDHFQPRAVASALLHSPRAVFMGTPQSVQQLRDSVADFVSLEGRILTSEVPVGEGVEMEVAGIQLRVMNTGHDGMPQVQNYMYLLEWNGLTAFHEGDADIPRDTFAQWRLRADGIDLAFVHWGLLATPDWLRYLEETVSPEHFIPMHISPGQEREAASRLEALAREEPKVHYLRRSMDRVVLSPSAVYGFHQRPGGQDHPHPDGGKGGEAATRLPRPRLRFAREGNGNKPGS